MAEGVVFDLGYRPHEGPRLGRSGARRALYRDGLRRVLGLRRRARSKVLPFMLISAAVIPALFFVALSVVLRSFDVGATLFGHRQYFDLTSTLALLFVALAAAELLVPDRVNGVMSVYASRPLTDADYLWVRIASLATVVLGFLWLPHLVLFLGRAWVDGFGPYVMENWPVLYETLLASIVYFAALAPLAFGIATVAARSSIASGIFLGGMIMSTPTAHGLVEAGYEPAALFALVEHPHYVKDWILGASTGNWLPEQVGYEPAVSIMVIAVVATLSLMLAFYRVRKSG